MTTNNIENLFQDIPSEIPSDNFTDKLMLQIEKSIRREQVKRRWLTVGEMAAGVIGIILTPILVLHFCSGFSFDFFKINLHFNPIILVIGLSVLFLLILDTLFRKHIHL